ncbi:hypothetical protein AURDEDRAFT_125058 [Auricularia subglabra TFB-10046 SS5]|nr:hypothetical protein AURDEDRAFT_125058 [Auricularia subglabra TFB-10046 SS5]
MPSLQAFRSRSRSQCSSSSKTQARSRPSTDSHDSSSSAVSYKLTSTLADEPPVPKLAQPAPHPALALYPFLANLPQFSGAPGEDIDLWIIGVDAVARHVGTPPDAPVPLIPILLRADAFRRFVRVHHATRGRLTSWADWKDHLRAEFRTPGYLKAKRAELAARARRPGEPLAHYFDARRELQMVVLPDASEDELVQDMLAGVPLRQRRLVVDTIPAAQRDDPTLVALRRAMVDCEVEMRGRDRLRGDRLDVEARRVQSHSPRSSTSSTPPSAFDKRMVFASAPLSPPLTPPARGDMPPPPTITVSG